MAHLPRNVARLPQSRKEHEKQKVINSGLSDTHDIEEEERLVKVGVLVRVLDDLGLNHVTPDLDLDARRRDARELELLHVAHAPAHDLQRTWCHALSST